VRGKDGSVSTYGTPGAGGGDPAALRRPGGGATPDVYAWRLTETGDPFGNRIVYEYRPGAESGATGRCSSGSATSTTSARARSASWSRSASSTTTSGTTLQRSERPDAFSEHRPGFEVRTWRRCTWIVVRTHADAERLVCAYRLDYLDERDDLPDLAERLPANGALAAQPDPGGRLRRRRRAA